MFTLFNRLSPEIRLQIWVAAQPDPRVINIKERLVRRTKLEYKKPNSTLESPSLKGAHDDRLSLRSDNIAPSKIFACTEARQVALKFYVTSFAFAGSIPEICFDFHVDTMYLRFNTSTRIDTGDWFDNFTQELESMYNADDFHCVRNLAILLVLEDNRDCHHQFAQVLRWFGNVQELKVVVSHFNEGNGDQGVIIYIEPFDGTKSCQNYETVAPGPSRCHQISDVLLALAFVFTLELERVLQERRQSDRNLEQEIE